MHIDFLHIRCWAEWWRYGMPMRIYYGDQEFVTILTGNRRMRRVWEMGDDVKLVDPNDFYEEDEPLEKIMKDWNEGEKGLTGESD